MRRIGQFPFIRTYLAATVAAGALTTWAPSLVSTTLDEHMAQQDLPRLSQYFSTAQTRVYDRGNFWQVPHSTFLAADIVSDDFAKKPVSTSIALAAFNFSALTRQILPSPADAYAMGTDESFTERKCYVRPPKRVPIHEMVNIFTDLEAKSYRFNGDPSKLADLFYVYIMAHEARHCDQMGSRQMTLLHETDADTYAIQLLRHIYGETPELREFENLLPHLRVIAAVAHGDTSHASDRALDRTQHTVMQAVDDQLYYTRLTAVLREIVRLNEDLFDDADTDYERTARYYHAAQALLADPIGRNNQQLRQAAETYIAAMDDLAARTDDTLIPTLPNGARLVTAGLASSYLPAPSRIPLRPAPTA